jgi:ketosteroid isomerase-like protein
VLVSVLLLVSASLSSPVRASRSTDAEFISFLEDAWVNAIITRNVSVLDRVMADDFIGVSPNGERYTKQEAIADVKSGVYSVENMELNDVKVRVLGDTAIVTYYQKEKSTFGDEDCSSRYAFTDVWVNRNDDWYVVSSHVTPVTLP